MTQTTLNIRGIDPEAVARIKRAAAARGWTIGVYVAALSELHAEAIESLRHGGPPIEDVLATLGLEPQEV